MYLRQRPVFAFIHLQGLGVRPEGVLPLSRLAVPMARQYHVEGVLSDLWNLHINVAMSSLFQEKSTP